MCGGSGRFEENRLVYVWSRSERVEYTRATWYQVVVGGGVPPDEWKEEHDYKLQELVRLAYPKIEGRR